MKKSFAIIIFLMMMMLCVPCSAEDLSATCSNGKFVGVISSDNIITWLGVPYAKPPIGSRRWKAPEAPDASSATFQADKFSAMPIQTKSEGRPASMMRQDEDCLYLNVWKASSDVAPASRPVMVWIHGGSFRSNGTGEPEWTGRNLVVDNNDIIVVSVGYRLGLMGFIDFSEVSGGADFAQSGNLGILDVLQSLKWLKNNIAAFGGDPNNITVFGQSSGSALISLLMTMPEAQGLFQRAILQSGSVSMSMSSADATGLAKELLKVTGTTNMTELMAVSSSDLQKATSKLEGTLNFPERDGIVLAEDVYKAWGENAGGYDILIGSNADEVNYFLGALDMSVDVFSTYVTQAYDQIKSGVSKIPVYGESMLKAMEQFIALQGGVEPVWAYSEFLNEILFRVPAITMAATHTGNTYMYYWNIPSVIPLLGACHGSEIPYVLDTPSALIPSAVLNSDSGQGIRKIVQGMWVDFAKDGKLDTYTKYTSDGRSTIMISSGEKVITEEKDPLSEQRQLMEPLLVLDLSGREIINAMSGSSEEEDDITPDTNIIHGTGSSNSGCNAGISSLIFAMLVVASVIRWTNHQCNSK